MGHLKSWSRLGFQVSLHSIALNKNEEEEEEDVLGDEVIVRAEERFLIPSKDFLLTETLKEDEQNRKDHHNGEDVEQRLTERIICYAELLFSEEVQTAVKEKRVVWDHHYLLRQGNFFIELFFLLPPHL